MSSFGLQDVSRLQLVSKKVTFSYFLSEKYFDWEEKITETFFFRRLLHSNAIKTIESKAFDGLVLEQLWVNWRIDWFPLKLWRGDKFHGLNVFFFWSMISRVFAMSIKSFLV